MNRRLSFGLPSLAAAILLGAGCLPDGQIHAQTAAAEGSFDRTLQVGGRTRLRPDEMVTVHRRGDGHPLAARLHELQQRHLCGRVLHGNAIRMEKKEAFAAFELLSGNDSPRQELEAEFRRQFARVVRAIARFLGLDPARFDDVKVYTAWDLDFLENLRQGEGYSAAELREVAKMVPLDRYEAYALVSMVGDCRVSRVRVVLP